MGTVRLLILIDPRQTRFEYEDYFIHTNENKELFFSREAALVRSNNDTKGILTKTINQSYQQDYSQKLLVQIN